MKATYFPLILLIISCSPSSDQAAAEKKYAHSVNYALGRTTDLINIYPDTSWLPAAYKSYYENSSLKETIQLFTDSTLKNDGISQYDLEVYMDYDKDSCFITLESDNESILGYKQMHPQFIENYKHALKGIKRCQEEGHSCWNLHDTIQTEPWAFFPQFGLPIVNQRSVLLLNYPPSSALTEKSYLNTFTMHRWERVIRAVGVENPNLYVPIIDTRPIAAPGSGASEYLPDAAEYFNDSTENFGGYYINPQIFLMLNPPGNTSETHTLPLVILGGPAREFWSSEFNTSDSVLTVGTIQLPGFEKITPYILGNHPDVTTYSNCDSIPTIITNEEIDLQVLDWQKRMASDPSQNPDSLLSAVNDYWVTNPSDSALRTICMMVKQDQYADSLKCFTSSEASNYCACHHNDPCATRNCDQCD